MNARTVGSRRLPWGRVAAMACQLVLLAAVLGPLLWMFSVSLKPANEPFAIPARLWPQDPTLANYAAAFQPEFRRYFLNSTIVSLATVVISVGAGLLCAYSLSRFRFRGSRGVLMFIIMAQTFPVATMIIPLFGLVQSLDLLNTYVALIAAYVTLTLPVTTWMLLGFVRELPPELEHAAMVDGASRLAAFWHVTVPLLRPGTAAAAVWVVVITWQEFMYALAFTTERGMRTVPVGMSDFIGQYGIEYGQLMASSVAVSLPIVGVFFVLQRYFVAGLTAGATKG